ncbi:hypothetical protein SLE2022_188440 [Rubroshorea leprosula]
MDAEIPLYLRIGRSKDGRKEQEFAWYLADLKEGRVISNPIVDEDSRIPPWGIAAVFVGSYLYVLGGHGGSDRNPVTDVFFVDTKRPQEGWTKAASMRCPRIRASAITVGGKIYVFGGQGDLGEVFDPTTNSWDQFPQPPFVDCLGFGPDRRVYLDCPVQLDSVKRRILIKFMKLSCFVAYYFEEERWTLLDSTKFNNLPRPAVIVDDVLYFLRHFQLYRYLSAFDLDNGKTLDLVWSADLESDAKVVKCSTYTGWCVMLRLGKGKLCLAFNGVYVCNKWHPLLILEVGMTPDLKVEVSRVSCKGLQVELDGRVDLDGRVEITYYLTPQP